MNRYLLSLILATGLAATGCGKKAEEKLTEKLIEKSLAAQGVKTDVDISGETMSFKTSDADGREAHVRVKDDEVTISGADGETRFHASGAGKMPKDFPADVPVYPGATVLTSMSFPEGVNLALESRDAPKDILAKYAAEMKGNGWEEKSSMNMAEMSMLSYAKDSRTASLIVQTSDGTTKINLTVATGRE